MIAWFKGMLHCRCRDYRRIRAVKLVDARSQETEPSKVVRAEPANTSVDGQCPIGPVDSGLPDTVDDAWTPDTLPGAEESDSLADNELPETLAEEDQPDTLQLPCLELPELVDILRAKLQSKECQITALLEAIAQERTMALLLADERWRAHWGRILQELSGTAVQIITQSYLHDVEGAYVDAGDVLRLAKRMVSAFQDNGLEIIGVIGQTVPFVSSLHEEIGAGTAIKEGQTVLVVHPGTGYRGKVLKKAAVTVRSDVVTDAGEQTG